ncbi:MAG: EamA family transporter RarD [Colwellia sp.]
MSSLQQNPLESNSSRNGALSALCAYLLWGFAPIYFKLLSAIEPSEIVMHRVIWSVIFLLVMVVAMKKWSQVVAICLQPKLLLQLSLSATFLALNWLVFIWAVNNNHLLDASLGYFINPIFNVVLGVVFFHERLRRNQLVAVGLALVGVLIQLIALGTLPITSLILATSFAIYGLIRKKIPVNSFVGLFIESLIMLPIAVIYWCFFLNSSTANMAINTTHLNFTLIMAGIVTTAPLLFFTVAAKRLTLSTLGFFQYLGPSIMFLLATFYYNETMKIAELITFMFIWSALILYSLDSFKQRSYRR